MSRRTSSRLTSHSPKLDELSTLILRWIMPSNLSTDYLVITIYTVKKSPYINGMPPLLPVLILFLWCWLIGQIFVSNCAIWHYALRYPSKDAPSRFMSRHLSTKTITHPRAISTFSISCNPCSQKTARLSLSPTLALEIHGFGKLPTRGDSG